MKLKPFNFEEWSSDRGQKVYARDGWEALELHYFETMKTFVGVEDKGDSVLPKFRYEKHSWRQNGKNTELYDDMDLMLEEN